MIRKLRYFYLTFLSAGLSTTPAYAQMSFPVAPRLNTNLMLQSVKTQGLRSASSENDVGNDKQSQPTVENTPSLNYTPSKSLRKKNLANFVAKTRASDPVGAARMEQMFAESDVIAQIDTAMRAKGLSASNAADAYAVWWVSAWQAHAGDTRDFGDATYQVVSAQAAHGFAATPQFAEATDAQKQEMAEAMLIQAALIDASVDTYAGDSAMMAKLSAAVEQGALKTGLDLNKMTLTEEGFVTKNIL